MVLGYTIIILRIFSILLIPGALVVYGKSSTKITINLLNHSLKKIFVIHRWWWKNKIVKGVDLTEKDVLQWYLSKEEEPYEVAISNFIVREDLILIWG